MPRFSVTASLRAPAGDVFSASLADNLAQPIVEVTTATVEARDERHARVVFMGQREFPFSRPALGGLVTYETEEV